MNRRRILRQLKRTWGADNARHLAELIREHRSTPKPYPRIDPVPSWAEVARRLVDRVFTALSVNHQLER